MGDSVGYIKLHRSLLDNELWLSEEPFCIRAIFIDLLLIVNYKNASVYNKPINRGQHWTSLNKLAERWHLDKRTVKHRLELLKLDGKIDFQISNRGILITVINYNKWQDISKNKKVVAKCTTECSTECTTECSTECTQTINDLRMDKENKEKASPSSQWSGLE